MKLHLDRPLLFFDLETTGINTATDRIVEIALLKVCVDGTEESKTTRLRPGNWINETFVPVAIPAESSAIHGITDEMVKDAPTFREISKGLASYIGDCDLAGFNSNNFDIPLLAEEFLRVGIDIDLMGRKFVDVQTIFHKKEERTLSAAYKFYCDKSLENAHSAEADTKATYEVLKAQLERYSDLENSVDFLAKYTTRVQKADPAGRFAYNAEGEIVFTFGKHKNKTVDKVLTEEPQYYDWFMNADFPEASKIVMQRVWKKKKYK